MITTDWISITLAPKDTRILLGFSRPVFNGISAIFGQWNDDRYTKKPKPYWSHDLENISGSVRTRANQPTHWMPNPPAPNTACSEDMGARVPRVCRSEMERKERVEKTESVCGYCQHHHSPTQDHYLG